MPNDCPICLDTPTNPAMTPCTHIFCRRCIGSWLDNHSACPVCRHRITRGRRALTTVAVGSPRRAASLPARQPPAPVGGRNYAQARAAAAANLAAGRASTSNAPTASRRSATSTTSASRRPTTTTTSSSRGNTTRAGAVQRQFRRCMYACTLAERRAFRNHGSEL